MSTEVIMLLCMIDAMEGLEVLTVDIPGTILHTNYCKVDIHINLEGAMVTRIKDIDPYYYKDFVYEDKRGRNCMYEEYKKGIYGTVEAALIFWGKLSKSLK